MIVYNLLYTIIYNQLLPVDLALQIAHTRLTDDDTLNNRTGLPVVSIMSLLSLCLTATYQSYQGVFYKQVFGTTMGSPVSVVVANLVMEDIESRALSSFSPLQCSVNGTLMTCAVQ